MTDVKSTKDIIESKLSEARALISQCEALADETDTDFHWDLEYGMSGWYTSGEWHPSSESC